MKIIETRPHYMKSSEWTETPIARLNYNPDTVKWQLYWMRASGKWEKYAGIDPTNNLQSLVDEIKSDPHGAFWG